MNNSDPEPRLIHVRRPLKRIAVTFEPVVPLDGPVTDGPLIRLDQPLKRMTDTMQAVPAVVTIFELPLVGGATGDQTFAVLSSIIQKVNEIETLCGRAGVWVDEARSGVREGKIEIVLAPNDPTDAIATCTRMAKILFESLDHSKGVTIRVFASDKPDTPVYELAV